MFRKFLLENDKETVIIYIINYFAKNKDRVM